MPSDQHSSSTQNKRRVESSTMGESSKRPQKILRIMSALPQRMQSGSSILDTNNGTTSHADETDVRSCQQGQTSPQDYVMRTFQLNGVDLKVVPSLELDGFFADPTDEEMEAYSHDVIDAIRKQDIDRLRNFHKAGRPLKCSNRFGESLLHMACRRGFVDVAAFLIHEACVPVRVKDDFGRTPLHDACWTCEPNFDLLQLILDECPLMMFLSDRRGHTPLAYARSEHWHQYVSFLRQSQHKWLPKNIIQSKQ